MHVNMSLLILIIVGGQNVNIIKLYISYLGLLHLHMQNDTTPFTRGHAGIVLFCFPIIMYTLGYGVHETYNF